MKKTFICLSVLFLLTACNKKSTDKTEIKETEIHQEVTFDRFEEAPVINDISRVPFIVYPKDSKIKLYVQPNEKADFIEQELTKTETLFGDTEVSNFYKIIYQVDQNPQNSKYAYVLRSDVDKDNELLLSENDHLNKVRYININGRVLNNVKSFDGYGSVSLIDKLEYNKVFQKNSHILLKTNNKPVLQNDIFSFRLRDGSLKEIPRVTNEEGLYELEYVGFSEELDRHFFKTTLDKAFIYYESFSTINNEIEEVIFQDLPTYSKNTHLVAYFANDEVGSLLVVKKYNPQDYSFKEIYAINFTNFKVSSSKNLVWENEKTLVAEIHHPNTKTTSKDYKKQYIRIKFLNL